MTQIQPIQTLENVTCGGLAFGAGLCFLRFCDRLANLWSATPTR